MDNIRASIETLFLQVNSNAILSHLTSEEGISETLGVDEEMFCQKFMVDHKCYTLDQVHELFLLLRTEWIKWPLQHERTSHPATNLFYILQHYTQNMLVEHDGEPICRYSQLLRWRMLAYKLGEDILTTSFLAFKDLQDQHEREFFCWPHVIRQDNPTINHILGKGITDLHFHLRGSSLNYELNWIALMNHIRNRKRTFARLKRCLSYRTSTLDDEKWDTFYLATIKACFIRYYLYRILMGCTPDRGDLEFLAHEDEIMIQSEIQEFVDVAGYRNPKRIDYANSLLSFKNPPSSTDLLLSGERTILYRMFYRIYSGASSYEEQVWFYIYLLQKAQVRRELIQLNEREGFGNFSDYEQRKEIFIENDEKYQTLVPELAVDTAFSPGNLKYLECRITPRKNSQDLLHTINMLDRQIQRGSKGKYRETDYFYIIHFIKRPDDTNLNLQNCLAARTSYRHFNLRKNIRTQAMATLEALKRSPSLRKRIVGIDAANTELYCRPEVFGPVFRYMKRFDSKRVQQDHSLKYTFHVGEDFWDITDGMRAIDEAILFLNLDANDRLGHALALGTDVEAYYRFRNHRVVMSKQNAMDNAVWLTFKAKELGIILSTNVTLELQRTFYMYYDEIYWNSIQRESNTCYETAGYDHERALLMQGRDMNVYYQSWLLRGDDPEYILFNPCETLWSQTAMNQCNELVTQARNHKAARCLFRYYHYNGHVRCAGEEKCEIKIIPEIIALIKDIQQQMCHQIASLHIGIEANITSNQFIGSMSRYIQHPIVRLYQMGLYADDQCANCPQMSVSINTDDKGVFDTSIEEEYALLALALEKEKDRDNHIRYQPRYIYEWLENIREIGFEQQFRK